MNHRDRPILARETQRLSSIISNHRLVRWRILLLNRGWRFCGGLVPPIGLDAGKVYQPIAGRSAGRRGRPLYSDILASHAWALDVCIEPAARPNSPGDIGNAMFATSLRGNHPERSALRVAAQRLAVSLDLHQWIDRSRNACHHASVLPGDSA
jgi:hypothetical protein